MSGVTITQDGPYPIFYTVQVEFSPEAAAKQYAEEAEASASAAAASATSAGESATAAATSAGEAATSASNSAGSAAAAATSASNSAGSATAAATSAGEAATSAGEAATSASNSAGSATAAATSAGEAATSASNSAGSATDAANSAAAAATSASNSAGSAAAAATSAGEAATSASNSAGSATDAANSAAAAATSAATATAAKDAVEGITDFTAGNLYRGNGTGIEAINEQTFLQSRNVFRKSYLSAFTPASQVFIFDSFDRPDGPLGTADSGQEWVNIQGVWSVQSATANSNTGNSIAGIAEANLRRGVEIKAVITPGDLGSFYPYFYLYKDAGNWVRVAFVLGGAVRVEKNINGTITTVLTSGIRYPNGTFDRTAIPITIRYSSLKNYISAAIDGYPPAGVTIPEFETVLTGAGYNAIGLQDKFNARGLIFSYSVRQLYYFA